MSLHVPIPPAPPPAMSAGIAGWLRKNLFSSSLNVVLTIASMLFLAWIIPPMWQWLFAQAVWSGSSREVCETTINGEVADAPGACWVFVRVRFFQLFFGLYYASNPDQLWRPVLMFSLFFALLIPLVMSAVPQRPKTLLGIILLFVFPFIAYALVEGSWLGLPVVNSDKWGGFMLTFILSSVGIVVAFPIGVLMALGRRSSMPLVRSVCIFYIELWRAAPLITILFMASNLLPLFLPSGTHYDKVIRAMFALTMFQSAYMAEAVRGGLQAVEKGQYEAADSLGLGYWRRTIFIVLPQALKIAVPGMVNSAIELFKDTTLVSIIGLQDFLQMAQLASRSPGWIGYDAEGFVFVAVFYFAICFWMSRRSQALERTLDTGHKRDGG